MNIIENVKQKMQQLDANTAIASTVATIGAMTTNGIVTIGYFVIAFLTAILTLIQSTKRFRREQELKEVEVSIKREELRTLKIENDIKLKELGNENT